MEQNIERTLRFVAEHDPEVAEAMEGELRRQQRNLELIASENLASPAVMAAMGSVLTNKYAEGYPGRRYYGGCAYVDVVETLAIERAKALFHAEHANVQPHSGAQANLAVYFALLEPGDAVLGMSLQNGGHLPHGMPINLSGKYYHYESYGVDAQTGRIDYDELARIDALSECGNQPVVQTLSRSATIFRTSSSDNRASKRNAVAVPFRTNCTTPRPAMR